MIHEIPGRGGVEFMRKLLSRIEKVLTTLAMASVFMMVCLTTIDSGGRYLFNQPIQGAYEITEKYLMVVSVFFALCYGYHKGCNIRVTFLVHHLPRRLKLVVDYIVQILSIVYGLLLLVSTFRYALRGIHDSLINVYGIPLGPAYMVLPVGLFMLTLWLLYDVGQVKKGKSGLFVEGEETPVT
jgi:TRAP-type C4-dicarboxylate transport system permease small subunit